MELAPVHLQKFRGLFAATGPPLRPLQQGIHPLPAKEPRGCAWRLQQLAKAFQCLAVRLGQPGFQQVQPVPPGRRPAPRLELLLGLLLLHWRRQGLPQGFLKGGHHFLLLLLPLLLPIPTAGQRLPTAGQPQLLVGDAEDCLDLGPGVELGIAGSRSRSRAGDGGGRDFGQLAKTQQRLQGQSIAPLQGLQIRERPPATLGDGLGPQGPPPDQPLGQ